MLTSPEDPSAKLFYGKWEHHEITFEELSHGKEGAIQCGEWLAVLILKCTFMETIMVGYEISFTGSCVSVLASTMVILL